MNIRTSAWALMLILGQFESQAASLALPSAKPAKAEAEVSAVKSPVKLTLSVYKTTLKLRDDFKTGMDLGRLPIKVGEPLWIKISLKNIGKKEMTILDDLFTGRIDFRKAIGSDRHYGVKVVVTGPDGSVVPGENPLYIPNGPCPGQITSKVDLKSTERVAIWKKDGKTDEEINDLLDREVQYERKQKEKDDQKNRPIIKLQPGEIISTGPWHKIQCPGERGWFPPQIGDFAELWNYHLDSPGIYNIKAVYFDDPFRKSGGDKIRFETPQIKITVLP